MESSQRNKHEDPKKNLLSSEKPPPQPSKPQILAHTISSAILICLMTCFPGNTSANDQFSSHPSDLQSPFYNPHSPAAVLKRSFSTALTATYDFSPQTDDPLELAKAIGENFFRSLGVNSSSAYLETHPGTKHRINDLLEGAGDWLPIQLELPWNLDTPHTSSTSEKNTLGVQTKGKATIGLSPSGQKIGIKPIGGLFHAGVALDTKWQGSEIQIQADTKPELNSVALGVQTDVGHITSSINGKTDMTFGVQPSETFQIQADRDGETGNLRVGLNYHPEKNSTVNLGVDRLGSGKEAFGVSFSRTF